MVSVLFSGKLLAVEPPVMVGSSLTSVTVTVRSTVWLRDPSESFTVMS